MAKRAQTTNAAKQAATSPAAEKPAVAAGSTSQPGLPSTAAEPPLAPTDGAGKHPGKALKAASIAVRTRPGRLLPRWRIGRQFTAEEVVIPVADLSDEQLQTLRGDRDLVVTDQHS